MKNKIAIVVLLLCMAYTPSFAMDEMNPDLEKKLLVQLEPIAAKFGFTQFYECSEADVMYICNFTTPSEKVEDAKAGLAINILLLDKINWPFSSLSDVVAFMEEAEKTSSMKGYDTKITAHYYVRNYARTVASDDNDYIAKSIGWREGDKAYEMVFAAFKSSEDIARENEVHLQEIARKIDKNGAMFLK